MQPRLFSSPLTALLSALIAGLVACSDPVVPLTPPPPPPQPGAVFGRVFDAFGGVVQGADVALDGPARLRTTSGAGGEFSFPVVERGSYSLSVLRASFEPYTGSLQVDAGASVSLPITLAAQSSPAALQMASRVLAFSPRSASIQLDLVAIDKDARPYSGLGPADFVLNSTTFPSGLQFTYAQQSASQVSPPPAGPFSATLLIDQSASMLGNDAGGSRFQAAKTFLRAVSGGDNVSLWAFASDGRLPFDVTQYGNGFQSPGSAFYGTVDNLAALVGGGTPLYRATYSAIGFTASNAPNANRAVVVFTDGDDTNGGRTLADVVNLAVAQRVRVYPVALSTGTNMLVLGEMASRTGGALMRALDARQLVSLFGSLGGVLRGSVTMYRTQWAITASQDFFRSGASFTTSIQINTPNGTVFAPIYVRVP